MKSLIIALDFDGTIKLPADYNIPSAETHLSYGFGKFYDWCTRMGIILVLWTCRNLKEEKEINYVYDFLSENGLTKIFIPISAVEEKLLCKNLSGEEIEIFDTGSNKMVADIYIDDRSLGCPVLSNISENIDWNQVLEMVKAYLK